MAKVMGGQSISSINGRHTVPFVPQEVSMVYQPVQAGSRHGETESQPGILCNPDVVIGLFCLEINMRNP